MVEKMLVTIRFATSTTRWNKGVPPYLITLATDNTIWLGSGILRGGSDICGACIGVGAVEYWFEHFPCPISQVLDVTRSDSRGIAIVIQMNLCILHAKVVISIFYNRSGCDSSFCALRGPTNLHIWIGPGFDLLKRN
jgi:hypothetical protein